MRIVFLSYNYSPDIHSPEQWIERIRFYVGWLECLAKEHTIIRVEQINYKGEFTANNVQYYCVDDGRKKNYFPRRLNQFVKKLEPDIVVVSSFLFPLQVIQLGYCLGGRTKIILQHHAEIPYTGVKRYLQKFASTKADAILFTTNETGDEWKRKGNLSAEKKVYELMEVSSVFYPVEKKIAKEKTQATGSKIFLWVGRLNENKDPLTVVKAFLKFSAMKPGIKLYMIYQTEDLLAEITKLLPSKLDNCPITLVGKIQHSDLLYWYNSADFFISASHYEGSGTALCEAMSCGCYPIVTDIPSFRKINNNCGLLYEPGNEKALVSALQQAIYLNLEVKKTQILQHFNAELSFEGIANKFQKILNLYR